MAFSADSRSEINVTPLIDVLLVLLIIFMVMVPLKPHGLKTQQPQGKAAEAAAVVLPPVVVELLADAKGLDGAIRYRVNTQEVASDELSATLKPLMEAREERTLFLRADRGLTFRPVAEAVAAAKQAGAVTVSLEASAKP